MEKSATNPSITDWRKNSSLKFSIGLVFSLTLVITAFEWNFKSPLTDTPIDEIFIHNTDIPEMVVVNIPPPPKPLTPPDPDNIVETKEEPVKTTVDPLVSIPSVDQPFGNDEVDLTDLFKTAAPGAEKTDQPVYELIPAEPVGGEKAFYEYLYKKIHYPGHLVAGNKAGKVSVKFVVDEKGRITDIRIIEGFDKALEKEIIRVLKEAPAWIPARKGAKNVRTYHTIPFSFDLR